MAYKLDEKPVSETLRRDMKLIVTTNPQLQEEVLNKEYATCKDFADKGGEYGYLYYEKLYEDEKEALVRQQLEKEINDLLYPMSIARRWAVPSVCIIPILILRCSTVTALRLHWKKSMKR